jgi:hypothetical protein
MLKLKNSDFLSTDFLVHRKGKSFAVCPGDVDDQDDPIKVLVMPRHWPGLGNGGPRVTITVKTFARLAEAAGALAHERGARFLAGGTLELGAGVTMAAILAERDLGFLHPVARTVGGPAVREAGLLSIVVGSKQRWKSTARSSSSLRETTTNRATEKRDR